MVKSRFQVLMFGNLERSTCAIITQHYIRKPIQYLIYVTFPLLCSTQGRLTFDTNVTSGGTSG